MVSVRKLKEEVKKEGEEPFFTKGLTDKWIERGDKLTLTCTVIGDPVPDIRWYFLGFKKVLLIVMRYLLRKMKF